MTSAIAPDDPRLAVLRGLGSAAARVEGQIVLEGELVLARARACGLVPTLVVAAPVVAERLPRFDERTALYTMDERAIGALVGFEFHRGVLAIAARPPVHPWGDLVASLGGRGHVRLLALDRIADAANLGAVLRSARALGVDAVALGPGCADPYSRRCLRASMGHALSLPLSPVDDLVEAMACGRACVPQLAWWATRGDGHARALGTVAAPARLGVVLGNEGDGVSPAITQACDDAVRIAMADDVDSLNVGAAAAVLLWALRAPT